MGVKYFIDNNGKRYSFGGKSVVINYDSLLYGLTGYWKFDETTGDVVYDSIYSTAGIVVDASINQTGIINKGVNFTDDLKYIVVNNTNQFSISGDKMSVSLWLKLDSSMKGYSRYSYKFASNHYGYILTSSQYYYGMFLNSNSSEYRAISTMRFDVSAIGSWYHIVSVCNGDNTYPQVYINGVDNTSYADKFYGSLKPINSSLYLMALTSGARTMLGTIDEFAVWNRVLSQNEILSLYNYGKGLTYPFLPSSDSHMFITTWDTTWTGSANNVIIIPTTGSGYDCSIYWDVQDVSRITGTPGNIVHTYTTSGQKTIKIEGAFPRIYFNNTGDKLKLKYIDNWGDSAWSSFQGAFFGCSSMNGRYTDDPCMGAVTSTRSMFYTCRLFNASVNFWTNNVTDMYAMFATCSSFNQPVSTFNTSKVTNFGYMFSSCFKFNHPVSNFDTSTATDMRNMFAFCYDFNQSLSNFKTHNVTDMQSMFLTCLKFNQPLYNFNTSKVTNMTTMFWDSPLFKQDVSNFNIEAISASTGMLNMFLDSNINDTGTTTNYDRLLISWAAQNVSSNIQFHGGNSKYSATDGSVARDHLVTTHLWQITDGGVG